MFYFMHFLVTPSNDSFDYMAISGGKTLGFDWTQQHRGEKVKSYCFWWCFYKIAGSVIEKCSLCSMFINVPGPKLYWGSLPEEDQES